MSGRARLARLQERPGSDCHAERWPKDEYAEALLYLRSWPGWERAAQAVRQHGGIENKLHWVLEVTFGEDESRIRRGNGAEVMSVLRRMTLNLLKQNTAPKARRKRKRKIAALDNKLRSEIIAGI